MLEYIPTLNPMTSLHALDEYRIPVYIESIERVQVTRFFVPPKRTIDSIGVICIHMTDSTDRSIGLALSGGGARCLAQVGALKAIEEAGYRVDAIAANSTAAVLAAVYATVKDAAELERIVLATDFIKLLELGAVNGLFGHDGIRDWLLQNAAARFEDLAVPLAVPTVDIEKAELLVFTRGELVEPVCASNAFPGLFAPVKFHGRHLMDGGIINNFPVDIIRTLTTRPVLAIDVRTPIKPDLNLDDSGAPPTLLGRVGALFGRGGSETLDILMQAYNITQDRLIQITAAIHPPDVMHEPNLPAELGTQNFDRAAEAIRIGYESTRDAISSGQFRPLDRA